MSTPAEIKEISTAELDQLLSLSATENVMTTTAADDKNILDNPNKDKLDDLNLDKTPVKTEKIEKKDETDPAKKDVVVLENEIKDDLSLIKNEDEDEEDETDPAANKTIAVSAIKELVKSGDILLFEPEEGEDEKTIDQYNKKELIQLFQANIKRVREEESEKAPAEFYDALPEKLKYAAKYVADGGKNLEGLFLSLAQSVQAENLDITTEDGQEKTVRRYLASLGDSTPEEIEEEINGIKDRKELEKKAIQYKPKLDAKQQQIVEKQLKEQEILRKQHETAAINYRETLLKAIQPGNLNGIKIASNLQAELFNGLTQAIYPTKRGGNTTLLGHLLETHQFVKPNPTLIAEVLYLLKDPEAYRKQVSEAAVNKNNTEITKKLKTTASEKTTSVNLTTTKTDGRKTIKKEKVNFLARPKP